MILFLCMSVFGAATVKGSGTPSLILSSAKEGAGHIFHPMSDWMSALVGEWKDGREKRRGWARKREGWSSGVRMGAGKENQMQEDEKSKP